MISGMNDFKQNQAYTTFKKENWRKRKVLDIAVSTAGSFWEEILCRKPWLRWVKPVLIRQKWMVVDWEWTDWKKLSQASLQPQLHLLLLFYWKFSHENLVCKLEFGITFLYIGPWLSCEKQLKPYVSLFWMQSSLCPTQTWEHYG